MTWKNTCFLFWSRINLLAAPRILYDAIDSSSSFFLFFKNKQTNAQSTSMVGQPVWGFKRPVNQYGQGELLIELSLFTYVTSYAILLDVTSYAILLDVEYCLM